LGSEWPSPSKAERKKVEGHELALPPVEVQPQPPVTAPGPSGAVTSALVSSMGGAIPVAPSMEASVVRASSVPSVASSAATQCRVVDWWKIRAVMVTPPSAPSSAGIGTW
jgi:hypothetical protein